MNKDQSHLGPTCDERGRNHIWSTTAHGHDICVDCKLTRKTPSPLRKQWLDEAVLRTLGLPFCKMVFGNAQAHNQLSILATMPETMYLIRQEYNRIADRACAEAPLRYRMTTLDIPSPFKHERDNDLDDEIPF